VVIIETLGYRQAISKLIPIVAVLIIGAIAPPLLPPLLAIVLAIVTRQVLIALFAGIFVGGLMVNGWDPFAGARLSLEWIIESVTDSWNATILIFDFIIGAFVGVLYTSGSMKDIARRLARRVRTARGASIFAWVMGLLIFFDDYTNTVIVGNTSRPLSDRLRVSRELLSYIVDSTAAPVAGLAFVSTWIGYEIGQIRESFQYLTYLAKNGTLASAPEVSAMAAWISSVPFRYYSILAIILVFLVIFTRRHFGPMLKAEHRAVSSGKVLRDGAQPLMPTESILGREESEAPWWIFVLSVLTLVAVTFIGLWVTGGGDRWWEVSFFDALPDSDAATALLWGGFAGLLVASFLSLLTRALNLSNLVESMIKGMYLMVLANAILVLAWSIKSATTAVGTADYVVNLAVSAGVPALLAPLLVFLSAMFISFTTGTSWGTFGIMMPIAIPLAWKLSLIQGIDPYIVTYATIASVFSGGIFGDHCSPISDTTIMSSMFSGADHIDHVTTQIPYALLAAGVSIVLYLLYALGLSNPVILLPVGAALLVVLHRVINVWYAKKQNLPPIVPNYVLEEA